MWTLFTCHGAHHAWPCSCRIGDSWFSVTVWFPGLSDAHPWSFGVNTSFMFVPSSISQWGLPLLFTVRQCSLPLSCLLPIFYFPNLKNSRHVMVYYYPPPHSAKLGTGIWLALNIFASAIWPSSFANIWNVPWNSRCYNPTWKSGSDTIYFIKVTGLWKIKTHRRIALSSNSPEHYRAFPGTRWLGRVQLPLCVLLW